MLKREKNILEKLTNKIFKKIAIKRKNSRKIFI